MTVITKWAIRRKLDGYYLPQPVGRNGRGGSRVEPINPVNNWENIRLLASEQAAKIALNAWLKGEWITHRSAGDYWAGIEPDEETTIHALRRRRAEDMEVVAVEVHLPGEVKVKPEYKLTGAVFIGDGVLYGYVGPEHPKYHESYGKVIKVSRILRHHYGTNLFETANSIYDVEFVKGGEETIPEGITY
jgi:hypothetical protein